MIGGRAVGWSYADRDAGPLVDAEGLLQTSVNWLWDKQATSVSHGELSPKKNKGDNYLHYKHIQTFFRECAVNDIIIDKLEQFKVALVL